jgi:hypothetical protein
VSRSRDLENRVNPGSDRRTVTASFRYGDEYRAIVGKNREHCWELARARWGEPDALELFSTPFSIYCDLVGITAEHARREGVRSRSAQPE